MKRFLRKDSIILLSFLAAVIAIFGGLLSRLIGASWIRTVIGFILMYFPVLLVYVMVQKRKDKREAERKSSKSSNLSTHRTQTECRGKTLVAQRRSDLFFSIKMYGICTLFGILAGFTISGFWSTMLNMNRCPVCGQYDAQKVHRKGPDASFYYTCSGGTKINQFTGPKPQQNTRVLLLDDR
jgi:uncharacterized membrane protein YfcA